MATDIYANVFMQDGMQIDTDFLNNGPRFQRAMLMDQIIRQRAGAFGNSATRPEFGGDETELSTLWAYCISPGRAFLRQGSANNKIQIAPGTLLQKIANSDGQDATLVPYTFAGTEEFTLTNGDATNPRVDLLQMKLEYITDTLVNVDFQDEITRAPSTVANTPTRRRIQCTLSVKAGTPAASPQIPDPDAGFVPIGTVVVGHGWTTGGTAPIFGVDTAEANNLVVHDQRMPMQVMTLRVEPVLFMLETAWSLGTFHHTVVSSNATNLFLAACPTHTGRLLSIEVKSDVALTANALTLGAWEGSLNISAGSSYVRGNTFTSDVAINDAPRYRLSRSLRSGFDTSHAPSAGPTVAGSAINKIGLPLWASGLRVPQVPDANQSSLAIAIQNQANPTNFGAITFYIAL